MPRKRISEFRAKTLLYGALGLPYKGLAIDAEEKWVPKLKKLASSGRFVVKVDQGIKGRHKKGLVKLDLGHADLQQAIEELRSKGYRYLLIEPFQPHESGAEYYLAMERSRAGNMVMFSRQGGVDVETEGRVSRQALQPTSSVAIEDTLGLNPGTLKKLSAVFEDGYMSFLEINPLVVEHGIPQLLDAAVEVDDEATPLVGGRWGGSDFRDATTKLPQELAVEELAEKSQASFRLKVLNKDGAVFLLLSGGGASIIVADEVYNQGYGKQLANYGEYSGNPSEEETYLYTKQLLSLLLESKADRKVLIIGGGVANFTDIRVTFRGVIRALDGVAAKLKSQGVKVYVRRGGPQEADGLAMMEAFLLRHDLHGLVAGPELPLAEVVPRALKHLEAKPRVIK